MSVFSSTPTETTEKITLEIRVKHLSSTFLHGIGLALIENKILPKIESAKRVIAASLISATVLTACGAVITKSSLTPNVTIFPTDTTEAQVVKSEVTPTTYVYMGPTAGADPTETAVVEEQNTELPTETVTKNTEEPTTTTNDSIPPTDVQTVENTKTTEPPVLEATPTIVESTSLPPSVVPPPTEEVIDNNSTEYGREVETNIIETVTGDNGIITDKLTFKPPLKKIRQVVTIDRNSIPLVEIKILQNDSKVYERITTEDGKSYHFDITDLEKNGTLFQFAGGLVLRINKEPSTLIVSQEHPDKTKLERKISLYNKINEFLTERVGIRREIGNTCYYNANGNYIFTRSLYANTARGRSFWNEPLVKDSNYQVNEPSIVIQFDTIEELSTLQSLLRSNKDLLGIEVPDGKIEQVIFRGINFRGVPYKAPLLDISTFQVSMDGEIISIYGLPFIITNENDKDGLKIIPDLASLPARSFLSNNPENTPLAIDNEINNNN